MFADGTHEETYQEGLAIRREVLGADHVERSMAAASAFSQPIQDYVTEVCWGGIWSRDGLDRAQRSLVNLGILTTLNRSHELAVHVRGAVRNGVTVQQIQEVLLQTAMYVGAPAALESFRIAERVLREELGDQAVDGPAAEVGAP
ncbi:4-carboxymuconolactone decarboxylase [Agrococcus versicolor]|uniref:4-carboxymuconolactone decarboxylase n=1 Tax=Agrococcus versicolor TaxID=501482 RepID=A0ABP5MMY9_9MICO